MKTLGFLLTSLLFAGCALVPPYRAHSNLEARAKGIRTVVLLPPRAEVFQLDTGGTSEKIDEWSAHANENIAAAIQTELQGRVGLLLKLLPEDSMREEAKSNLEETHALFDAVNTSIILHTYSPPSPPESIFEEKIKDFDYSLGSEVKDLRIGEADSLILVRGVDHIWTEGRKALQVFGVILGIGAGVGTGAVVIPVLGGGTTLNLALIDPHNGSILWYKPIAKGGGYDFRDPASVNSLVKELFKDFPIGKEK